MDVEQVSHRNMIPTEEARIVIINCSTKELTALALMSAIRHAANVPVSVIDCESNDGSVALFRELQKQFSFTLSTMPLRIHGATLDTLFRETSSKTLVLLDSDAEILDGDLVPDMLAALQEGIYGSGFLHPGEWLPASHGRGEHKGYYAERMWIPCVALDARRVNEALTAGQSFRQRIIGNEIPRWPRLASLLHQRFRIPGLRQLELGALASTRRTYPFGRPHYIYRDTGASIHDFMINESHLRYADLGATRWPHAVRHYHGVTRRRLRPWMRNAADILSSRADAITRIENNYGIRLPDI